MSDLVGNPEDRFSAKHRKAMILLSLASVLSRLKINNYRERYLSRIKAGLWLCEIKCADQQIVGFLMRRLKYPCKIGECDQVLFTMGHVCKKCSYMYSRVHVNF